MRGGAPRGAPAWLWAVGDPMPLEVTLSPGRPCLQAILTKRSRGRGTLSIAAQRRGPGAGRVPPGLATPRVTRTGWLFPYLLRRVPANNEEEILSPSCPGYTCLQPFPGRGCRAAHAGKEAQPPAGSNNAATDFTASPPGRTTGMHTSFRGLDVRGLGAAPPPPTGRPEPREACGQA